MNSRKSSTYFLFYEHEHEKRVRPGCNANRIHEIQSQRALFRYIRTRNAVGEPTQLGAGKRTDVDRYSSWKEEKKLVLSLSNSAAADVHFIIIIPTRILV